ncbi:hypothetical protein D8674_026120 [Pyrus ussuriensis x Pyrus communis]|uniref:Uncharacterized protein n=1 Tax=Pyrus ussuriensis x Pyrus communis TaxID=2448454 RepID=A0A5N5I620_9ROSA|nr:hypothetical protein D8674_026120 [Pyrus ussuriensis x Pyrus communis]
MRRLGAVVPENTCRRVCAVVLTSAVWRVDVTLIVAGATCQSNRHGQPSAAGASLETAKVALRAVEGDFSPKSHEFLIINHRKHQLKAQGLTLNRFKRSGGPIYLGLDGFPLKTLAGFWK